MIALIVLAAQLLSGCDSAATPVSRDVTSDGAGSISVGTRFADLIPLPSKAFAIDYQWPNPEATGRFSWRQGNGLRRWDVLPTGASNPSTGTFKIETMFQPGSNLPQLIFDCSWDLADKSNARVNCTDSVPLVPLFSALTSGLLNGRIAKSLGDQTIVGHDAACYQLAIDGYAKETMFCIDKNDHSLLRFSTVREDGQSSSIEADSIRDPAAVQIPSDLPPLAGDAGFVPSRPLSHLDLPPSVMLNP